MSTNTLNIHSSCLSEAYGAECLATAVRLLGKICKGVKYYSYAQNHVAIPVACMNLVGAVSDFTLSSNSQVWKTLTLKNVTELDCLLVWIDDMLVCCVPGIRGQGWSKSAQPGAAVWCHAGSPLLDGSNLQAETATFIHVPYINHFNLWVWGNTQNTHNPALIHYIAYIHYRAFIHYRAHITWCYFVPLPVMTLTSLLHNAILWAVVRDMISCMWDGTLQWKCIIWCIYKPTYL